MPKKVIELEGLMTPYHCVAFGSLIEPTVDDCWLWQGELHPRGYGIYRVNRRKGLLAHRVQYWIYNRAEPEQVVHTCNVSRCVNPRHLEASTARETMVRKTRKGRHGNQKITVKDKERMIVMYRDGMTQKDLATIFGVSQSHISNVINGKASKWAPEEIDVVQSEA